ncbi:unnamed protein product [Sphagnum balticum]
MSIHNVMRCILIHGLCSDGGAADTIVSNLPTDPFNCAEDTLLNQLAALPFALTLAGGAQHCQSFGVNCKAEYCADAFLGVGYEVAGLSTMSALHTFAGAHLIGRIFSDSKSPIVRTMTIALSLME